MLKKNIGAKQKYVNAKDLNWKRVLTGTQTNVIPLFDGLFQALADQNIGSQIYSI